MTIKYKVTQFSIETLLNHFKERKLRKPSHQRLHRWDEKRQKLLIETIKRGLPIPSLTIYRDDNGVYWIEDGVQRIYTIRRFHNDENDALLFSNMESAEQISFLQYKIPILIYENATLSERIEIFDRLQNGLVLSTGERLNSLRHLAPTVDFACELFLYPDSKYKTRFMPFWGERTFDVTDEQEKKTAGKRFQILTQAVMVTCGLLYGYNNMSENYDKIRERIRLPISDQQKQKAEDLLKKIFIIYENANAIPINDDHIKIKGKALQNAFWKPTNFTIYILYSLIEYPSLLKEVSDSWVRFLGSYRSDSCILKTKLLEPVKNEKGKTKLMKGFECIIDSNLKQKVENEKKKITQSTTILENDDNDDTYSIEDD